MRLILGVLLFVPLAIFIVFFAVENQTLVSLRIWPFADSPALQMSVWILGPLAAGLILGMLIGWLSGAGWRRRARRAERQVRAFEKQMDARDNVLPPRSSERAAPTGRAAPLPPPAENRAARAAAIND